MDFNLTKTKIELELTPAKRYSFLVGVNEKSHTAQSQFEKILLRKIIILSLPGFKSFLI